MAWMKNEESRPTTPSSPAPTPSSAPSPRAKATRSGGTSLLGPSLSVEGEITGAEDLTVAGRLSGRIQLPDNAVLVDKNGRIEADITARSVRVRGDVKGDLHGGEEVVVESGGSVRGNIVAPRVVLEDGAKFKGAIDMEPDKLSQQRSRGGSGKVSAPAVSPRSESGSRAEAGSKTSAPTGAGGS